MLIEQLTSAVGLFGIGLFCCLFGLGIMVWLAGYTIDHRMTTWKSILAIFVVALAFSVGLTTLAVSYAKSEPSPRCCETVQCTSELIKLRE